MGLCRDQAQPDPPRSTRALRQIPPPVARRVDRPDRKRRRRSRQRRSAASATQVTAHSRSDTTGSSPVSPILAIAHARAKYWHSEIGQGTNKAPIFSSHYGFPANPRRFGPVRDAQRSAACGFAESLERSCRGPRHGAWGTSSSERRSWFGARDARMSLRRVRDGPRVRPCHQSSSSAVLKRT